MLYFHRELLFLVQALLLLLVVIFLLLRVMHFPKYDIFSGFEIHKPLQQLKMSI